MAVQAGFTGFFLPKLLICRKRFAQPSLTVCAARATASASAGTFVGHHRAGADIGAVADLDRRHQRRVRADEGAVADIGAVLGDAVVIAGDGAGADIGARADPRVADIS